MNEQLYTDDGAFIKIRYGTPQTQPEFAEPKKNKDVLRT